MADFALRRDEGGTTEDERDDDNSTSFFERCFEDAVDFEDRLLLLNMKIFEVVDI